MLTINLGSNSLIENDSNRLTLATSDYVIYSDFNPVTLENDVGLIKLRLSISFTGMYIKIGVVINGIKRQFSLDFVTIFDFAQDLST